MIEANTNETKITQSNNNNNESVIENKTIDHTEPKERSDENEPEQNQGLIKTESRTGYVNLDGTERENANESNLSDLVKETINKYYNDTINVETQEIVKLSVDEPTAGSSQTVEVDDIIVPEKSEVQLPSVTKTKEVMNMLPKVIQDFLNSDWKSKPKCEPQKMLERIRREQKYPDHPDVYKYELLLTPAPSFLQRISLAGEFLNKKQLEL